MSGRNVGVVIPEWQRQDSGKVTPFGVGPVTKLELLAFAYGDENGNRKQAIGFVLGEQLFVLDADTNGVFRPEITKKVLAKLAEESSHKAPVNIPNSGVNV